MKFLLFGLAVILGFDFMSAQQFTVRGTVYDSDSRKPIPNVIVTLANNDYITDSEGLFELLNISKGQYNLEIKFHNYESQSTSLNINKDAKLEFFLERKAFAIKSVEISKTSLERTAKESSSVNYQITKDYLDLNRENTLVQSLQNMPGIQAMNIGNGQSKPILRGLGFNRVVVSQHGIKHEAQQWGNDHGLEIDQYDVENIEIIKGPASLFYGSDAIGGVINLRPLEVPKHNGISGTVKLTAESNNDLLGTTIGLRARKNNWFYRLRLTTNDYGDFKVPTDKIIFETYVFPLYKNHLRNTAGNEKDASISFGYDSSRFKNETFISNYNSKNGFFANAHGLEVRTSSIDYDHSSRDIDLPYHTVNHFKIINSSNINVEKHKIKVNFGFQNNVREERTEAIAHGYMPKPDGTLDRRYTKNTYTFDAQDQFQLNSNHTLTVGGNAEFQDNSIDGWGFLIPSYTRITAGIYAFDKYAISKDFFINAGIRYDAGNTKTDRYDDWYQSITPDGLSYIQRAQNSHLNFDNISAVIGASYVKKSTNFKVNIGKSFRMPLANELSANGVNYHMFRYEKGNTQLKAETSYQMDAEASYDNDTFGFSLMPFVNYFDNYIYLNPTSNYFETLQIYEYTQNKVFRAGGEISVHYKPFKSLEIESFVEYIYSKQLNGSKKGFSLPFSPPVRGLISMSYLLDKAGFLNNIRFKADVRMSGRQKNIVPPEQITEGFSVFDFSVLGGINLFTQKDKNPQIRFKINNVFNTKYYNHLSFYRLIDVPEPGRNFSISLTFPF